MNESTNASYKASVENISKDEQKISVENISKDD
jgi:hypothetical protein